MAQYSQFTVRRTICPKGRQQITLHRSCHFHYGYEVYSIDDIKGTGAVTYLGFIDARASPLTLAGINLADGTYDLLFRFVGFYWKGHEWTKRMRVKVSGGELVATAPAPIIHLETELNRNEGNDLFVLSWYYQEYFGALMPDYFGVWVSYIGYPDPSDPPQYIVSFDGEQVQYRLSIPHAGGTIYVRVAAITGVARGPRETTSRSMAALPAAPGSQTVLEEPQD